MSTVRLCEGDCLDVLRTFPDNSIDAVVTDPPYGLSNTTPVQVAETLAAWVTGDREHVPAGRGFMGATWDAFVPPPAVWDEVYRVLKPGGHALVFAGARTQDLMGVSLRLAGFDVRDGIAWLTGQGFPKSKQQLKPANEPILLVRKPFKGSLTANIAEHGTGALNIDECRIEGHVEGPGTTPRSSVEGRRNSMSGAMDRVEYDGTRGRWPTNVILDEAAAAELDQQSGTSKSTQGKPRGSAKPGEGWGMTATGAEYNDEGGASRFFKVVEPDPPFMYVAKAPKRERPNVDGVQHSTVKPLKLIEHLVTLITPPGGTVLDLFGGSGTAAEAAIRVGRDCIIIEEHEPYIPLIQQRANRATTTKAGTE